MNADDFIIGADEPAATILTCPIHGCRWQYRTIEDTLGQLAAMATIHAIAHAAVDADEQPTLFEAP